MGFLKKILNPYATDSKLRKEDGYSMNSNDTHVKSSGTEEHPGDDSIMNRKENIEPYRGTSSISDIGILVESVKELIMDSVAPFTGNDDFSGISLWINSQFYHILNNDKFKQELRASFDSMHLYSLGCGFINFVQGEPTSREEASPIIKDGVIPAGQVWIRLHEKDKVVASSSKAVVSIFQGNGSCKEKEYILGTDDKAEYRIGRGSISRKPGSTFRQNDIVVEEDNPDNIIQKLNNYVSSAQADIILDDGHFYIRAMPSGCRLYGGSPTKIIRGNQSEIIELRDSYSRHLLKNGDIIELGKSVLLLFTIIE